MLTKFQNFYHISQFWPNFTILTKYHNFYQILHFWPNFTTLPKFHNVDKIVRFWQNFTIMTNFQNFDQIWQYWPNFNYQTIQDNADNTDNANNTDNADSADNAGNADNAENLYNKSGLWIKPFFAHRAISQSLRCFLFFSQKDWSIHSKTGFTLTIGTPLENLVISAHWLNNHISALIKLFNCIVSLIQHHQPLRKHQ